MSILQNGVGACSAAPIASINTLGFAKPPSQTRVVAAMSGGVDSSVVAVMLKRQGYEVIGITLQLYDHGAATSKVGACCAGQDIHDARRVADAARIPHYVLDYESRFREAVMEDFADTYLSGATPIPCVRCNQTVKFADLKRVAEQLGADCLATGHYVRRVEGPAGAELHRAADPGRDQSYFLFATTRAQLEFLRFPLGDMPKPAVRALAAEYGVRVAEKPDSQDICFVPQGKYQDVVKKLRPGAAAPGEIVDTDGHVLGQHDGIVNYTVGQRRGLGVATGQPLFVVKLDAGKRRVIVGPRAALGVTRIALKEVNWIGDVAADPEALDGLPLRVRVRSTRPPVSARLSVCNQAWAVQLDAPEEGVAPGQAAVFYDMNSTRVLGGGWIAATDSQSSN